MGLFWTLYGALTAGFLAGAAVYLWRWKQPPETVVETVVETKIIQAPPTNKVILCRECKHSVMDNRFVYRCKETGCQTAPEAFCSKAEKRMPDAYANSNLSEAEKMEIMLKAYQGERISL